MPAAVVAELAELEAWKGVAALYFSREMLSYAPEMPFTLGLLYTLKIARPISDSTFEELAAALLCSARRDDQGLVWPGLDALFQDVILGLVRTTAPKSAALGRLLKGALRLHHAEAADAFMEHLLLFFTVPSLIPVRDYDHAASIFLEYVAGGVQAPPEPLRKLILAKLLGALLKAPDNDTIKASLQLMKALLTHFDEAAQRQWLEIKARYSGIGENFALIAEIDNLLQERASANPSTVP
jgi:hypothetical protein